MAGFVIDRLGRLPGTGDRVKISGHPLTMLVMDRMRIGRIRVTPANDPRVETSY
ncbi:transporter associated domain-containing protein [Pseudarthrobacter humi]|uniref:transporter associated domain-containing protein n=1 Tax=Pseudarthrobacter humi TaxID=2952523 RepID=UPI0027E235A9|nr:transporter associated domain-containing protein [Pseudarthrobacter humi]